MSEKLLTVVLVAYNMQRELPRTLHSLTSSYQIGISPDEYNVVVADNGSVPRLSSEMVESFGPQFHYRYFDPGIPSPCIAINTVVREASTPWVLIAIDGARIFSPGILRASMNALDACPHGFAYALTMHLGKARQDLLIEDGWTLHDEDALLEQANWTEDGYKLFTIAAPAGSTPFGFGERHAEATALALSKALFEAVGGYDESFVSQGGGVANLDIFNRLHETADSIPISLLGEATFHQMHGGITTNRNKAADPLPGFWREYEEIRGVPFRSTWRRPFLYGRLRPEADRHLMRAGTRIPGKSGLIVLGMHRSGTSCLAGMLQQCGFFAGAVEYWNADNRKGNRETLAAVALNDKLLKRSDGSWDHPPERIICTPQFEEERDLLLQELNSTGKPWMFKDPRTLLALPFWLEGIASPNRIGVFRHPLAVAESLAVRNGMLLTEGLKLWLKYNECLIREHRRVPFPVLSFDLHRRDFIIAVGDALRDLFGHLITSGKLDLRRVEEFFDEKLVHYKPYAGQLTVELAALGVNADVGARVAAIYAELCGLSNTGVAARAEIYSDIPSRDPDISVAISQTSDLERCGDYEGAIKIVEGLVLRSLFRPDLWMRLINLSRLGSDRDAPSRFVEQGLKYLPDDPWLLMEKAQLLWRAKDVDAALSYAARAAKSAPSWSFPRKLSGYWSSFISKWEDTEAWLEPLVSDAECDLWTKVIFGCALICRCKLSDGERILSDSVNNLPADKRSDALRRWGLALRDAGLTEQALAKLSEACSVNPAADGPAVALADLQHHAGHIQDAINTLERALSFGADSVGLRLRLARILLAAGRDPSEQIAAGLALDPQHHGLHQVSGEITYAHGHFTEALKHFTSALSDTNPVPALMWSAKCHVRRGDPGKAAACLDQILSRQPGHQAALRLRTTLTSPPAP